MLTEKDYCNYKLVLELKELGYDYIRREGLIHLYDAQKWLREEKNIVVRIIPLYEEGKAIKRMSYTNEVIHWDDGYVADECIEEYDSYEEALLEGVRQAIEILKEK